jgi:SAM-dependent methyltransferase
MRGAAFVRSSHWRTRMSTIDTEVQIRRFSRPLKESQIVTRAQNSGFSPSDRQDAEEAYGCTKLSDPHDLLLDWLEWHGVFARCFSEPIDFLDVGPDDGELTFLVLQALFDCGAKVRSVTCVEPDPDARSSLELNVVRMQRYFPNTSFRIAQVKLEEFSPADPMPPQFHLVMATQVYPYLSDPELCFALLSEKLLRPNGRAIITAQMPVGRWAVNQELCATPAWPYKNHIFPVHMDVLREWTRASKVHYHLDVLWGDGMDVSPCFTDSKEGELILSLLVGDVFLGGAPELLSLAREALSHHSRPLRTEPTTHILPDPFGVLIIDGKDVEIDRTLASEDRSALRYRIRNPWTGMDS